MHSIAKAWCDKGQFASVHGHQVFYRDSGGEKPTLVILHGFPTSSLDYLNVWRHLTAQFRVIVHDHIGFGLSAKPNNFSYSFIEQADVAEGLWAQLGIESAQLVAHDYGTSVATELMARECLGNSKVEITSYLLSNGSVHIELAKLRLIQKLLRNSVIGPWIAKHTSYSTFANNIENIFFDASKIEVDNLKAHWDLMIYNNGRSVLPKISQYTRERVLFWQRWIGAIKDIDRPIDLLWATNDPIARPEIAKKIHQEAKYSRLHWLEDCGHFPMLEKSEQWSEQVIQYLMTRSG